MKVIFRKDKEGNVIAFMPQLAANPGNIVCYQHIGQHGEASVEYYFETVKAKYAEYKSLKEELQRIYDDEPLETRERLYYNDLRKSWESV